MLSCRSSYTLSIERTCVATMSSLLTILGRLLCLLGLHKFRVVDVTLGFGPSGGVAKFECKRCHHSTTRRS